MTTTNLPQDQEQAIAATREQDTRDTEVTVTDFVTACIEMHVREEMPAAPVALWNAGMALLGDTGTTQTRIGYVLALDALAQSPQALAKVAADLRARLVDTAPGLEALKR